MTKTFEQLFYVAMITLSLGSLAEASSYGAKELYEGAKIESAGYIIPQAGSLCSSGSLCDLQTQSAITEIEKLRSY